MTEIKTWLDTLGSLGVGSALALVIYAGWKGELAFGRELRTCRQDFQAQIDQNNLRHAKEIEQLRNDFRAQLAEVQARATKFEELLLDQRSINRRAVETAAHLAKKVA